jgi:guanine nucleotide-binding protein subunit alpha
MSIPPFPEQLFPLILLNRILEALAPESDALDEHDDLDSAEAGADLVISSNGRPPSAILGTRVVKYDEYRKRLAPLVELEERLTRLLAAPDEDEAIRLAPPHPSLDAASRNYHQDSGSNGYTGRPTPTITIPHRQPHMQRSVSANGNDVRPHEPVVRSGDWKRIFSIGYKSKSPKTPKSGEIEGWWEDPDDPVHTLHPCARAMLELWADPQVRIRLDEKRLRLQESSGL